jgi:hypothetical protein
MHGADPALAKRLRQESSPFIHGGTTLGVCQIRPSSRAGQRRAECSGYMLVQVDSRHIERLEYGVGPHIRCPQDAEEHVVRTDTSVTERERLVART